MKYFTRSIIVALTIALGSCEYMKPKQQNLYLVRERGSLHDLRGLAVEISRLENGTLAHKRLVWDESNETHAFDIRAKGVSVHVRNSLKTCRINGELKPGAVTVFVNVYETSHGGKNVSATAHGITTLAKTLGWHSVGEEQCRD